MTARYSPVAPPHLLWQLHKEGLLNSYLLFLAHDVLEQPEPYERLATLMKTQEPSKEEVFFMMDNSVIELGAPMPIARVLEAAEIVGADVVMTPDILHDRDATLRLSLEAAPIIQDAGFELMRIPQGKNYVELCRCIDLMMHDLPPPLESGGCYYWGIPRWIASALGTRRHIVEYIADRYGNCKIHLLGMSRNVVDDLECTSHPQVIGIDSANPCVAGHLGVELSLDAYVHWQRGDYWTTVNLNDTIQHNVRFMHQYVGNA